MAFAGVVRRVHFLFYILGLGALLMAKMQPLRDMEPSGHYQQITEPPQVSVKTQVDIPPDSDPDFSSAHHAMVVGPPRLNSCPFAWFCLSPPVENNDDCVEFARRSCERNALAGNAQH